MANLMMMGQGNFASYNALASKSQYEVYFTTDTHQIFVGAEEYTKSTKTLSAVPTESTAGDIGRLYFYDGNLYLCQSVADGAYTWLRVANINDTDATLTSIEVGEGLTTASGSTSITKTDEIKHAIPSGAAATADDLQGQEPAFGETFNIKGIATDKFGHVTGIANHTVKIPVQTSVGVAAGSTAASTLSEGDSFTVITGVAKSSEEGASDHDLVYNTTTFTLPSDEERTYEISSTVEGTVTLTDDTGATTTALINGWNDLAKKSELASVFKYKGSVATVDALPADESVKVGDVYQVAKGPQGTACEYVAVTDGPDATWEELGTTVDLSAYATTAFVEEKLTWHEF